MEGSGQGVLDPQMGHLKSIVTAARDITERKATEQALRQARADAKAANRAKTAFLANISHEVRTPLNGIVGMDSLLERTALSPRQQQCVDTLRTSGNTLLNLINDLLDLSKIEAGKLDLEAQPFDPRNVVHEVVRLVAPQAAEKALELVCGIDETVPPRLVGDAARLQQIVLNLLSNAIKFTETGSVVVRVDAEAEATAARPDEARSHRVRLSVEDTGIGIPEALIEAGDWRALHRL